MRISLQAGGTELVSTQTTGALLLIPDGLWARRVASDLTVLEVPPRGTEGSPDVLVGTLPLVHWDEGAGRPEVTFLDVPPPPPFGEADVEAMWTDVAESTVPLPTSVQIQGRSSGDPAPAGRGLDPEVVPEALGSLAQLIRRWPQRESVEVIWKPPDVRGGREDVRTTDRLGSKRGGLRRPNRTPIPDLTARRRGTSVPWASRRLAAACSALEEELAQRAEDMTSAETLRAKRLTQSVARRSLAGSIGPDSSVSSWPHSARSAFRAVIRALVAIAAGGAGGLRVPLCDFWRLYEAWVAVTAYRVLVAEYGEPTSVGSAEWSPQWHCGDGYVRMHVQATIQGAPDPAITGHPNGILSVSSDLRPDVLLSIWREGGGQAMVCLDAKQRTTATMMESGDVAAAASKYLWGLRRGDDPRSVAVSRTLIVSSAPVEQAQMFDEEMSRIGAAYLTPSGGDGNFCSRLIAAVEAALKSV